MEGKKKITKSKPKTKPKPKSLGAKPIKAGQHVSGILCPLSRFKVISYDYPKLVDLIASKS